MKKKDQWKVLAGIVVLVLIVQYAGIYDFTTLLATKPADSDYAPTTTDIDGWKQGVGMFEFFNSYKNSLVPGTDLANTDLTVSMYVMYGGQWVAGPVCTGATAVKWEMKPEYGGYVWFLVEPQASTDLYFVDYKKIVDSDPYVEGYMYTDADADGVKEFMFKYNMQDHSIPNSGYPAIWFYAYALAWDNSASTILSDEANLTGISTTTITKYVDHYFTMFTEAKGVAVYKIQVKVTTTDETKVKLKKVNIPGIGYVDGTSFDYETTSTQLVWTYKIASSFNGALYWTRPTGASSRLDMTVAFEYTLTGGDDLNTGVYIYLLQAGTEAGDTESDTWYAQA